MIRVPEGSDLSCVRHVAQNCFTICATNHIQVLKEPSATQIFL